MQKTKRRLGVLLIVLAVFYGQVQAQEIVRPNEKPLQFEVAAGIGSYYVPGMGVKYGRQNFVGYAGIQRALNKKQLLAMGLRLGYARGNYQGDAFQLQALLHFNPLLARHLELGLATGAGYQLCFYPSQPLKWSGEDWVKGKSSEGVFQLPLQLSLGYRSIKAGGYAIRPYLAYQLKVLLGYSPDLSPLPVSDILLGFKISSLKKK